MAHDHDHHGNTPEYFTEQLLTIFVVGLFGFTGVWLYSADKLQFILAPQFQLPVLIGGVAVLAVVAIRAVSVWREAGAASAVRAVPASAAAEGHVHGPDCDHEHGHERHDHTHHDHHGHEHHDHQHAHARDHHTHDDHGEDDHGHSHDLSWVFLRMLVLAFAVGVGLFVLPKGGLSQDRINALLGTDVDVSTDVGSVASGEGVVMSFNDLREAAYDEGKREALQGKVGIVEGKFRAVGQNQFTLYKLKMTCCAADTVPLKIRIITPTALSGFGDGQWVRVKGEVRFLQLPNSSQYLPVIAVADIADVQKAKAKNEYE